MFCFSFFPRRVDEESSKRSESEKLKREMENQIEELKEDLDSEKTARTKAEKQRRELGEVMNLFRLCIGEVGEISARKKCSLLLVGGCRFSKSSC